MPQDPRRLAALVAVLSISSCNAKQWVIHISTDAPVPQLGSLVQVEIYNDQGMIACDSCTRLISANERGDWPVSLGLALEDEMLDKRLHVRARLLRADHLEQDKAGDIAADAYLDRVGVLPELQGKTAVHLFLGTDCFGVKSQLRAGNFSTCDPATGLLDAEVPLDAVVDHAALPRPGSWPPGKVWDCQGPAPEGMVCVPGGAFVLGGKQYLNLGEAGAAQPEHLTVLRPFFMDTMEYTARRLYALRAAGKYTGKTPLTSAESFLCMWTGTDKDVDNDFPINCVPRSVAADICKAEGKRLPTETEWEYGARNLQRQTVFAWGDDGSGDFCERALVGRGFLREEDPCPEAMERQTCGWWPDCRVYKDGTLLPWWPMPVCTPARLQKTPDCFAYHPRDQTDLGIWDMAGNLSEWVQDAFAPYTDDCWKPPAAHPNWLDNPVCKKAFPQGPVNGEASWRGGSWWYSPRATQAASRFAAGVGAEHYGVGFRCVKNG